MLYGIWVLLKQIEGRTQNYRTNKITCDWIQSSWTFQTRGVQQAAWPISDDTINPTSSEAEDEIDYPI